MLAGDLGAVGEGGYGALLLTSLEVVLPARAWSATSFSYYTPAVTHVSEGRNGRGLPGALPTPSEVPKAHLCLRVASRL